MKSSLAGKYRRVGVWAYWRLAFGRSRALSAWRCVGPVRDTVIVAQHFSAGLDF
jgi:hypothetical protein